MIHKLSTLNQLWKRRTTRVLAFTCSRDRPLMLRHCIMQMQRQSIPVDHVIYVNSSAENLENEDVFNYQSLLDDLVRDSKNNVVVGHGVSLSRHKNNLVALHLVDIDNYDLFLKIDDDDIYFADYARTVVQDFEHRSWDYSGTHSRGVLNGIRWIEGKTLSSLGLAEKDHALNIPEVMPPTTAFSRKAIRAVMELKDLGGSDDQQWRRHLAAIPGMSLAKRDHDHFVYHIHGGNVSTSDWLED